MIYLDNAATSYPKPDTVIPTLEKCLGEWGGNPGRSGHRLSLAAAEAIYRTREAVADLIGSSETENIIFTQNATFAINTIIRARITPGIHVLISDMEHNSVFRPIWRLAQDGFITYSVFSHKGNICDNIRSARTPRTKMLLCTHISNTTGFEFPLADIARVCKEYGIYFIVDASQSIGHRRVNVQEIECDALCAPGHKGLLGIQGSGFLYVRSKAGLKDVFQGGSGAHSLSPEMPDYLPDRFEAGTLATPAIATMEAGIRYIRERGLEDIDAHEQKLSRRLHEHIRSIPDATLYSTPNSGIVAFTLGDIPSEEVAALLDRRGICVRGGHHCAPLAHRSLGTLDGGLIRVSIGAFNSMGEIELTAHHIKQIIKHKRQ